MTIHADNGQADESETEAPLGHHVTSCLDNYFKSLNGEQPSDLYRLVIDQVESPLLSAVMDYTRGNQTRASNILGINRGTLRRKLRNYGLE